MKERERGGRKRKESERTDEHASIEKFSMPGKTRAILRRSFIFRIGSMWRYKCFEAPYRAISKSHFEHSEAFVASSEPYPLSLGLTVCTRLTPIRIPRPPKEPRCATETDIWLAFVVYRSPHGCTVVQFDLTRKLSNTIQRQQDWMLRMRVDGCAWVAKRWRDGVMSARVPILATVFYRYQRRAQPMIWEKGYLVRKRARESEWESECPHKTKNK